MKQANKTTRPDRLEQLLGEASWLLSHAQALGDYGRREEAAAEYARAAACAEQVACLLDAAGREAEGAVHRVSAASCHERLGNYPQAVTLLRAALSVELREAYRADVEVLLAQGLAKARKSVRRPPAKQQTERPTAAP